MEFARSPIFVEGRATDARKVVFGGLVCIGYFLGTKLGLALTFQPHPISTLWPPNAILLAALLLTPVRLWWLPILALEHVVAGRLNKQIAADLGTAEKTVKVHRARVMEKMRVGSVAELARLIERVYAARPR